MTLNIFEISSNQIINKDRFEPNSIISIINLKNLKKQKKQSLTW